MIGDELLLLVATIKKKSRKQLRPVLSSIVGRKILRGRHNCLTSSRIIAYLQNSGDNEATPLDANISQSKIQHTLADVHDAR